MTRTRGVRARSQRDLEGSVRLAGRVAEQGAKALCHKARLFAYGPGEPVCGVKEAYCGRILPNSDEPACVFPGFYTVLSVVTLSKVDFLGYKW